MGHPYIPGIPQLYPVPRIIFIYCLPGNFVIEDLSVLGPFQIDTEKQFFQDKVPYHEILATYHPYGGEISGITGPYIDYVQSVQGNIIGKYGEYRSLFFPIDHRSILPNDGQGFTDFYIELPIGSLFDQERIKIRGQGNTLLNGPDLAGFADHNSLRPQGLTEN